MRIPSKWGGQCVSQVATEKQNTAEHGQQFEMSEFWPQFFGSTFENWQSEWLQLFTQAVLLAGFANVLIRKQDEEHYKT